MEVPETSFSRVSLKGSLTCLVERKGDDISSYLRRSSFASQMVKHLAGPGLSRAC